MTSPDELSILHWNVHSWRDEAGRPNHEAVLRLIGQTSPDMVSLVEVNEPWGRPAALRDLAGPAGTPGSSSRPWSSAATRLTAATATRC